MTRRKRHVPGTSVGVVRRLSVLHNNCFTLGQGGHLAHGIPLDEYRNHEDAPEASFPQVYLRQGASRRYRLVEYETLLSETEKRNLRMYKAVYRKRCGHFEPGRPSDGSIYIYAPALVSLRYGYVLPETEESTIIEGPLLMHPGGAMRDGFVSLGDPWEHDRTAVYRLVPGHVLMVSSHHEDDHGELFSRIVSIVVGKFLVMRMPSRSELDWFVTAQQDICREQATRVLTTSMNG